MCSAKLAVWAQADNTVNLPTRLPMVSSLLHGLQSSGEFSGFATEESIHVLSLSYHLCVESSGLPVLCLANVTLW